MTANPLHDVDYMPDTYAAEVETVPTRLHLILWTSTVVLVAALVWARFATLDEVARAEGRVIPSGQVQVVQNLEGGILAEVLTQVGDHVTEGQNLIRLVSHTRVYKSFPTPPSRSFLYAYVGLTNWQPHIHYFTLCALTSPMVPPVAVPEFPFNVKMQFRATPFSQRRRTGHRTEPYPRAPMAQDNGPQHMFNREP